MNIFRKYGQLDTNGRLYLLFISFFWLFDFFGALWRRVGVEPSVANFILLMILALLCYGKWRHLVRISDVSLFFFFILIYLLSPFVYPKTQILVYSNAFEVLCLLAPFYFVGVAFNVKEYTYWITLLSRLAVIVNVLYSLRSSTGAEIDEESMHKAYILLPSVLFILWQFMERYKLIDLLFFALGFFMECSMGSRGPFVCILFFTVMYLLFFREWKYKRTIRIVLIAVGTFLYLLSKYIAEIMIILLATFGKSTRIFDKMLDDSLINYENSSGRDQIHEEIFQKLSADNVGIGYGLYSDRILTDGYYAHNIFIELWCSFGYVIGSILVGIILVLFIRFFLKSKGNDVKIFGLIFFTASFIKLMFSGSFIIDGYFYFLLGYCINGLRESKSYKINSFTKRGGCTLSQHY